MRNTIIGIVIGIVVGVMIGATVIAPRLEQAKPSAARHNGQAPETLQSNSKVPGKIISPSAERIANTSANPDIAPLNRLRVASSFALDMAHLGTMAGRLETELERISGGAFDLKMYGPGVMVPSVDTFKAVQSGTLDAAFSSPGQWASEIPALQLFSSIPFGPSADEYLSWYYFGGGEQIFSELHANKGVHALVCGAIPAEASGWFRRQIRTTGDFQGLRVRAFGLGAKVLDRLGADIADLDSDDIYGAFEQDKLDGAEFSMPSVDRGLKLYQVAKHYYFPGWHQPSSLFSLMINAKAWEGLSSQHRVQIETVCGDNVRFGLAQGGAGQFEALKALGLEGVQVHRWPDIVISALNRAWFDVVRDEAEKDKDFARTWSSIEAFRRDYAIWQELSGL